MKIQISHTFLEPFIVELGALYGRDLQFLTCRWPRRTLRC
jgi:hypothetical protein